MANSKNIFGKYLFLIIPLVGIVIAGIFLISYGITDLAQSAKYVIHGIIMTAGLWLGCMMIVVYLWRKFPWEESPGKHLVLEVILILAYTSGFSYILYLLEREYWDLPEVDNMRMEIFITFLITFLVTAIHESVFFYQQWKYNFSRSVRLEKDNLEARYEALRTQINPHFLFNSLNGLATMVEGNKPAVEYVQNLSGLLRYMLKSGERELVPLSEEMEITRSYINLQMNRFTGSLIVKTEVPEELSNHVLPPLTLQMLVENCIKHNVISRERPLTINIKAEHDSIQVINNLQLKSGVTSTGQGLKNIKGRYSFFTKREVVINEGNGFFSVIIPLLRSEI
jgi:two-component system, LytTR family, sensor kinase